MACPPRREGQLTVPHAMNTTVDGTSDVGLRYPLNFSYSISATRTPSFDLPISGNSGEAGQFPSRVSKEGITITAQLGGEKLDPYLKITGKRADLTINLRDIGFS